MAGKAAAYSTTGRLLARKVMGLPEKSKVRSALTKRNLDDSVRRMTSEGLPKGTYYAKLTINNWKPHNGKPFSILQNGELVYGNQIEPPARGFPLEYRNIIVSSDNPRDFELDIDASFSIKIGRGSYTTPQQLKYDKQYDVEQHGDVYYSLRGNTTNPKKILLTFPGFGPSTSRISYAVSYLKALTDTDLKDTLMVCFQDRYLAAGSYMMVDNAGRPLYSRVRDVISGFASRFKVANEDILFFGASKGGSIAIHYAQEFEEAQLLLAVPQMSLPYYFNKPFFRNNLFQNQAISSLEQPQELLRRYFSEGRKIDYFYTNNDELSNHSLIEFAHDVPNLTKYRVNGVHGAVARAALPSMLGLMRQFLKPTSEKSFTCEQVREFPGDGTLQIQVRVDLESSKIGNANWFLEGTLGRTIFRQIMSNSQHPFVKYTADNQKLFGAYDSIDELASLTVLEDNGAVSKATLNHSFKALEGSASRLEVAASPLLLESAAPATYNMVNDEIFDQYRYVSQSVNGNGDTVEVRFTSDLNASDLTTNVDQDVAYLVAVEISDDNPLIDLIGLRLQILSGCEKLRLVDADDSLNETDWAALENTDWATLEMRKYSFASYTESNSLTL
ncbi:hypothetical protein CQ017_16140 [Arthrobacter sp. MYb224]|nr:hypothetical protein CQ017_16140 [Arthrobacter sp. MYb224]